jgi:hypothetical protein
MSLAAFTTLHVVLSLIGILAGGIVLKGMLGTKHLPGWTALFLAATFLTSATGFLFPFTKLLPSHVFGIVSIGVLTLTTLALYVYRLEGASRWIYVATAWLAFYLNVFVAVVQAFLKIAPLKGLAPTQTEPPFFIAQGIVLLLALTVLVLALRSFRPRLAPA